MRIPQPKSRAVLGDRARGERDMRSAASGDEMGPTHAERGKEAAERGRAKYPSILGGGRETRSRDKGGRARAGVRIGSYAYGDRVMSCRHAPSPAPSAAHSPNPLTKLRANKGRKMEKWTGAFATPPREFAPYAWPRIANKDLIIHYAFRRIPHIKQGFIVVRLFLSRYSNMHGLNAQLDVVMPDSNSGGGREKK